MADIIIIGAGIAGLLSALELRAAGAHVTLIEKGLVGQESSWAGGGILSPLYPWRYPDAVNELARWGQHIYPTLAHELYAETGEDPQWTASGLLILQNEDEIEQARHWAQRFAFKLDVIPAEMAFQIEPALDNVESASLWLPEIAQIHNPRFIAALKLSLLKSGVRILEKNPVEKILIAQSKAVGVITENACHYTDKVVVTTGAWTGKLAHDINVMLPIEPVRGQMLCFAAIPGLIKRILLKDGHYLIPRRDGVVLVGSTIEYQGFDKSITTKAHDELYRAAISIVPALQNFPIIMQWAGLRPSSPKGIPFIGEHPQIKGLFFNAGHFRNGFVLTPGSARLLTELITGRAPFLNADLFKIPTLKS